MKLIEHDLQNIISNLSKQNISYENKTILVTGGAGFLGSWISEVLVNLNANVLCLDNFSSGLNSNITHLIDYNNFKIIQHDISEPIYLEEKIDIVMHFASRASPLEFTKFPIQILRANTFGTWVSLEIAKKNEAKYVLASTSEVYGDPDPKNIPTSEDYFGNVNPNGVRSCYDESKRVAEAFVMAYYTQYNLDSRIVRIHNTYGPRMRAGDIYGRVVTRFIDQAIKKAPITVFGDGTQTRSFTYVSDMIEGILKTTYNPKISGEIINLGSDQEVSINKLAEIILDLTNSLSKIEYYPLPPDDPRRRCPDISKAKKMLGWNPKVTLEEGLNKSINWLKKHHEEYT